MDESGTWRWDDPTLKSDDSLYRRVPNQPSYFRTEDRFNGDTCLTPVAFSLSPEDYDPTPEEVAAVSALDPPPADAEDARERLSWGKDKAKRAYRGWCLQQQSGGRKVEQAGCSVQIESLMKRHGITAAALVDWETHVVGRFSVQNVRDAGGGVIAAEDYGDPVLGKVHGLVRTQSPGMKPPSAWSELRGKLLDKVQYFGRTVAAPPP